MVGLCTILAAEGGPDGCDGTIPTSRRAKPEHRRVSGDFEQDSRDARLDTGPGGLGCLYVAASASRWCEMAASVLGRWCMRAARREPVWTALASARRECWRRPKKTRQTQQNRRRQ